MSETLPIRFTVMSLNLWADNRMPDRTESIQKLLCLHQPDILCLQELRATTRDLIDQTLSNHGRVEDPFAGWIGEGNIYFNSEMFKLNQYGAFQRVKFKLLVTLENIDVQDRYAQ